MNVVWHACNHAYFVLAGVDVRVAIIVIPVLARRQLEGVLFR